MVPLFNEHISSCGFCHCTKHVCCTLHTLYSRVALYCFLFYNYIILLHGSMDLCALFLSFHLDSVQILEILFLPLLHSVHRHEIARLQTTSVDSSFTVITIHDSKDILTNPLTVNILDHSI